MRDLSKIKGVGEKTLVKLNSLGIYTTEDLVGYLPFNYVDLDAKSVLSDADEGEYVVFNAKIITASKPFRKGKLCVIRAQAVTEIGEKVKLCWFNSPYVSKNIKENVCVRCYGKLKKSSGYEIINPVYEKNEGSTKLKGIKPVYAVRGKIQQSLFASIVKDALKDFFAVSVISQETIDAYGLDDLTESYKSAHMPSFMDEAVVARKRIHTEELIKRIASYKLIRETEKRSVFYRDKRAVIAEIIKSLPFVLSETQLAAVNKITEDLLSDKPLNAMLCGDVGSGKTVVAVLAAAFAALSGFQSVVMAPTEILALQHYRTFTDCLSSFGIKICLITGGMNAQLKKAAKSAAERGEADIIIGTHAVISKNVQYKSLSLVIADEQHRFGVGQRTALIDKTLSGNADVLTLSATPIPRSLRLTLFGDIDILNIERRYSADNIKSAIVKREKRNNMLEYIVSECEKGRQAYIVTPKIVDDEGLDVSAAEGVFEELRAKYSDRISIALMHGNMSSDEKASVLNGFYNGCYSLLVSTTVIEVGIDVKKASIMAVMDAERFGLAALHQLRGRIGRDGNKGFFFLYTTKDASDECDRLEVLVKENDGLKIAEYDYERRGAGDWLGESQSGRGLNAFNPAVKDLKQAKELANMTDFSKHRDKLLEYAEKLKLKRVSLN